MPSFLENLRPFYGTNEKNAAGESLEEFLEHYDPYKYRTPSCTTDAVIFLAPEHLTKELKGMRVLLVKRSNHPSIGFWALPGGFIEMRENLDDTARRELLEETSVDGLVMEQIGTYGDYDRDPRTRVITTAYMAVLQGRNGRCAPAMMRRTLCGAIWNWRKYLCRQAADKRIEPEITRSRKSRKALYSFLFM